MKGKEVLKLFQKQLDELHFWQILKRKKLEHRIERLRFFGLSEDYLKNPDETYKLVGRFDPDKLVRHRKKQKEVTNGNECVSRCLNCKDGAIFEVDPIERIGQCNVCFTEFKLS